ncbi:F-box domain-containing protein [Mycena sanguinolenta]|uniref:F-box domain-containing protein n=1 Tax=Mycena sanguinolenta TaxID=230812 RepID=A0A8H6Y398_9AGAR|nr:F-box domain-containing protein [Mycena sanguinolenta]
MPNLVHHAHLVPPIEAKPFLLNNEPPSDEDIPTIQDFIVAAREHHANLRETETTEELSHLENLIVMHTSTLSSIRRMPAEILSQIFRCISHKFTRTVGTMTVSAAPWRLAHVCRHWRATALADAHIWSSIRLELPPIGDIHGWSDRSSSANGKGPELIPLAALETQLRLSKDAPLDVSFNWSSYSVPPPHLFELLHAVVGQCHRWQKLKAFGVTADVYPALLPIKGRLPLLRSIETDADRDVHGLSDDMQLIFTTAPRLRQLLLTDKAPSLLFSVPWDQITHLRACFSLNFILQVFPKMANLEDCEIVIDDGWTIGAETPVVVLPSLRRLRVQDDRLLEKLEAPRLESLEVNGGTFYIPPFLQKSGCQLRRLELSSHDPEPTDLISLFLQLPTLQHLSLDVSSDNLDLLFRAATISGSSADLCPKLTSILIFLFPFTDKRNDYDSLCTMIESRWNVELRRRFLDHVRISVIDVPDAILDRFEALKADGLPLGGLNDRELSRRHTRRIGREPGKKRGPKKIKSPFCFVDPVTADPVIYEFRSSTPVAPSRPHSNSAWPVPSTLWRWVTTCFARRSSPPRRSTTFGGLGQRSSLPLW